MKPNQLSGAARAGRNGNHAPKARVLVEGKYVTYAGISERTGRTVAQCKHRYAHVKRTGKWPVTWESLA